MPVSFDIVSINHVYAMYGYLFQDLWEQMRPFVQRERELKDRAIGFVVEDLCLRLSRVKHDEMARALGLQMPTHPAIATSTPAETHT